MIISDGDCLWIFQCSIGDEYNMKELVEKYNMEYFEVECNPIDATWDVYRKPKRVKVDFSVVRVTSSLCDNSTFYAVRFKIENWSGDNFLVHYRERDFGWVEVRGGSRYVRTIASQYTTIEDERCPLYIGQDAQDKWSTPVIFNRKQRGKLHDLVKYLEDKLNGD